MFPKRSRALPRFLWAEITISSSLLVHASFQTPPVNALPQQNVTFTVEAAGRPLTYQWQHRGTNIPNQTNASLTIQNVTPDHAGPYAVVVSNSQGYIRRTTALNLPPPAITTHPMSREVQRSDTATFSVAASGFPPLKYQWWHNGTNAVGSNSPTLSLVAVDSPQIGDYRVVVSDVTGASVQSAVATLTMIDPRPRTFALRPVADTSISSGNTKPQGGSTLLVGRRGFTAGSDIDRALIRFDLTSIPANATVLSAELKLVVVRAPNTVPYTLHLHRLLTSWTLFADWSLANTNAPWSTPGAGEGTDYITSSATGIAESTAAGFFASFNSSANLHADLQTWIQNPGTNHGWIIISDGENAEYSARHLGSSESQNPPRLTLTYEIPASAPSLSEPLLANGNFAFQIEPTAGWFYAVEAREHLDRGEWLVLTNIPGGNGLTPLNFTLPATNRYHFFRVNRY
ncbi:MAG TPA: immunoglobulin domain-containing protein [Candidatus Kapabacteria bacterium]|nr:immunoglobulin domain-containing protein [Candidatus Kapabacteria bacterium]